MAAKVHNYGSDNSRWVFHCPGCEHGHAFVVPQWTFNGNVESPTFAPSLLVNPSVPEHRCHLIMANGKICYQADCYHKLAGQTVDCPDWEESA